LCCSYNLIETRYIHVQYISSGLQGLESGEKEILKLQKEVEMTATTQINQWLNEMQDGMIASLKT
jgi:hypothetical protein